jgi:hypothetical protein
VVEEYADEQWSTRVRPTDVGLDGHVCNIPRPVCRRDQTSDPMGPSQEMHRMMTCLGMCLVKCILLGYWMDIKEHRRTRTPLRVDTVMCGLESVYVRYIGHVCADDRRGQKTSRTGHPQSSH